MDCELPVVELIDRHQVLADFVKKRTESPVSSETIRSLQRKKLIAYSLHSGRYRAATWYHQKPGIVWLLAARWHEEGSPADAYPYFEALLDTDRLLPTREDVERVVVHGRLTFERALMEQVPAIRDAAIQHPGELHEAIVGGRIRVRVAYQNGDTGILTVAVGNRLIPGEMSVPAEWLVQLLAAFFLGVPLHDVEYIDEFGGAALREDEDCFCALMPAR
jgi:hypothetical protein